MITVEEVDTPLKRYDISANVDGGIWLYQIAKKPMFHMTKGWQERGYVHAYYHAKNGGSKITFNRVDSPGRPRTVKRTARHVRLFD